MGNFSSKERSSNSKLAPKQDTTKESKIKSNNPKTDLQKPQHRIQNNSLKLDKPTVQSIFNNYKDDEIIFTEENKVITSKNDQKAPNISDIVNFELIPYHKICNPRSSSKLQSQIMAKVSVPDIEIETKASIDLICVIDKSGSMQGDKIRLLIDSFKYILEYLGPKDRVSVVSFSSQAERLTPLLSMNDQNKSNLLNTLKEINANGGTDIALGVIHALEIISQRRYVNQVTSILVLSDGLDSGADEKIETLLKKYENNSVSTFSLNTFGYGSDHDPALMSKIASFKDGSFYFIDKLNKVAECFIDCLGGLISVIAEDVNIQIKSNSNLPNIKFLKAYGPANFWNLQNDGSYTAKQQNLISGKNYHFIFDVEIDFQNNFLLDSDLILIASASCQFKGVTELDKNKIFRKDTESHLALSNENIKEDSDGLNLEVLVQYYRVKSSEEIEKALKLAEEKKFEEAQKILLAFKENVQNSIVKDKEFVINLLKDVDAAIKNVTPVSYDKVGKHFLLENLYCNIRERSNKNSNVDYQNYRQKSMQTELLSKKK